ncbi:MAG: hypothetical protein LBR35_00240 [Rickettsiales bacterium]|jgi:hypothetical protein|nr:hypothetical protein [Rickettsiales bacterium]
MKKTAIFLSTFLLFGCDTASHIFFGVNPKPDLASLQKKIDPVPPPHDFYGRPIFMITYDNSKTDYGQGLYHALTQSLTRNPNQFFLIVSYYDGSENSMMKEALKLRQEMENLGLDKEKIIIKAEQKSKNDKYESLRLYER